MKHLTKSVKYKLLSLFSPVIACGGMLLYLNIVNFEFWEWAYSESGDSTAGALMAFSELIQIMIALIIGCFIGVIFAIKSIRSSECKSKMSFFALCFNAIPFILFSGLWIKGIIVGI
jgi:hypothetical protein